MPGLPGHKILGARALVLMRAVWIECRGQKHCYDATAIQCGPVRGDDFQHESLGLFIRVISDDRRDRKWLAGWFCQVAVFTLASLCSVSSSACSNGWWPMSR